MGNKMDIMISVVMSIFNEKIEEINKSIDSILNQTYKNFEFVIVLDNPDNKEIKKELEKIKDSRVKIIINEENKGLAFSLNRGIKFSKGKYILRMDADDISLTNRLEKQIEYLLKNDDIDLLGTAAYLIDENEVKIGEINTILEERRIRKRMKYMNSFIHPTLIVKKSILEKIGLYREFPCAQDYDLILRIIDYDGKVANLSEKLLYYRVRENSLTSQKGLFQFLLAEYAKKLSLERKKEKRDNFSKEVIEKLYQEAEKNKNMFNKFQKQIKINKNKYTYYFILIKILILSKYHRKMLIDKIKYLLNI